MAVNVLRVAGGIKTALVAAGAIDGPATMALAMGIASAVLDELTEHAEVTPGIPPDGLAAPTGGGPVVGSGKIE